MIEAVRALDTIRKARQRIIAAAADLQAAGVDTEPLNLPLIDIQQAIAELEAMDLNGEAAVRFSVLAANLRTQFNAVRISGAGLETEDDRSKRLRWLELMEQAADECIAAVGRMGPLMWEE